MQFSPLFRAGVGECSVLFGEGRKTGRERAQWKAFCIVFVRSETVDEVGRKIPQTLKQAMIKRNTHRGRRTHRTFELMQHAKMKKKTAKPKAAKSTRKKSRKEERKNDFHEIYFEAAEFFCFIYLASVDEVGSVFSCAPSVEVIKQGKETDNKVMVKFCCICKTMIMMIIERNLVKRMKMKNC